MPCPFCAMDLPRPHSEVDMAQLEAKARALGLFCHPDKRGGDHKAYLFLVACKEECEKRMRKNETTCYLEQARGRGRGSNKQPAAAGGAPGGYVAAAGPSPPCTASRSSFDHPSHDRPGPPGDAHGDRAGPSTEVYWKTSNKYRFYVALTETQARDGIARQALRAAILSSSSALPLWSCKERALGSFFRECNRRGQSVSEPANTAAVVLVAASDTGGFDPVSRNRLEGRRYRVVDNAQLAAAQESIAHLFEVNIPADQMKQLQELKIVSLVKNRKRMDLRGILPLVPGSFETEYLLYESIGFLHWMDHYVATEYYFRCTGRCSRVPCAAGGTCVTWLFIVIRSFLIF